MQFVRRLSSKRRPGPPERSFALRRAVFIASIPPMLAIAWVGQLWAPMLLALAVLAGGHSYSGRRLTQTSLPATHRWVQVTIFGGLHLLLAFMFAGLFVGLPLPQAQFALYAQAITSFDLRRRGNLYSSLGLSLINLYVAATLSRDYSFLLFILAFLACALAVFVRAEIEDGARSAKIKLQTSNLKPQTSKSFSPSFGIWGLGFGISALAVFLFLPRFASRPIVPPFSINLPIKGGVTSQVINPGAPLIQVNGIREPDDDGDYYYGFDSQLDLRYRGGLSDIVVMYVRSPAWSYWRSHSYDFYDGHAWSQSDETVRPVTRWTRVTFEIPSDTQALGEEIAQTFYIVHDQPNLVFAAYRPTAVALNSETLVMDSGDGLRAGGPLVKGATYTVLSRRPNFSAEQLRAASGDYPPEIMARYLQLPDHLSARVRDLARQLTTEAPTSYDRASVIRDYLVKIPYDFFPPPQPPGSETVDNFLFVDRRGVCEQFATAMTVMLRAQGIPARLVAGYGAGEYNALSGYYTVRASDAHAWVEVYFPGYGWVPFDPTPGVEWRANPYTEPVRTWFLSGAFEGVSLPLGEMFSAGAALFSAALAPLGVLATPLALACFVLLLTFLFRRLRRRSQPVRFAAIDRDPHRQRILATYRAAQSKLKLRRAPAETPRELAQRLSNPDWDELTLAVEQAAYRVTPPSPSLARRVREVVARLRPSPPTPLPK